MHSRSRSGVHAQFYLSRAGAKCTFCAAASLNLSVLWNLITGEKCWLESSVCRRRPHAYTRSLLAAYCCLPHVRWDADQLKGDTWERNAIFSRGAWKFWEKTHCLKCYVSSMKKRVIFFICLAERWGRLFSLITKSFFSSRTKNKSEICCWNLNSFQL